MIRQLLRATKDSALDHLRAAVLRAIGLPQCRVVLWDGDLWILAFDDDRRPTIFGVGHERGTRRVGPWEGGYDVPMSELTDVKPLVVLDALCSIR